MRGWTRPNLVGPGGERTGPYFYNTITVPFQIVWQSWVTDPPDGAEIGRLSWVTLALAGCDKEVQKK